MNLHTITRVLRQVHKNGLFVLYSNFHMAVSLEKGFLFPDGESIFATVNLPTGVPSPPL